MTTGQDFAALALTQRGDRYIFGVEVDFDNPNPPAFDCSELVQWTAARLGISPPVPDGAYYQWSQAKQHGRLISVASGINTVGALLFMGDGTGVGRDAITHVAVSLGNGYTIEARGSKWGVGVWSAQRSFDYASLVHGVDYRISKPPPVAAKVRTVLKNGDRGNDVKFVQGLFNIILPVIADKGYGSGQRISEDGAWGPQTGAANQLIERFWNHEGPGQERGKRLHEDQVWTMAGTAPAVAALVKLIQAA